MRSNKQSAGRFCPLLDTGPPKGEVWVQVKRAILPYHIEDVGTGVEGKIKLQALQTAQRHKDQKAKDQKAIVERREAIAAFETGEGALLDLIRTAEEIDIHTSVKDLKRQDLLFPPETPPTRLQSLWKSFKKACKDVWDGAQES